MKFFKIIIFFFLLFNLNNAAYSSDVHFVDIKYILNNSKAGKGAQDFLKKKYDSEKKKLEKEMSALKKAESDLIAKKKIVSKEEYKKSLDELRKKSVGYQKKSRQSSTDWINKKNEARKKIVNALSPILQKYMKENKIDMIVDKKYVLMADSNFDLTNKILKILDKELKSVNLN